MAYVPIDRFLVRAPLLAAAPLGDAARRLIRDPLGARALAIASPSLAAQAERALSTRAGSSADRAARAGERDDRAARAIDRYARRAAFRATPAGLLAGVTVGTLGPRTGGATGTPLARFAPSWARIARLGRSLLDDPAIRIQARLRLAPSLLRGADRVRWLASGSELAEEREADLDPRLARILDACGAWTPWSTVRAAAGTHEAGRDEDGGVVVPLRPIVAPASAFDSSDDDDDEGADADELLLLLIDDDLLCCDLTPPLIGPPAATWMAARLAALQPPPAAARILARASAALDSGDLDAGRAALRELPGDAGRDTEGAPGESGNQGSNGDGGDRTGGPSDVLATLVHQPARALTLDRATVERAAQLAPLLFRLQDALAPPAAERLADRGARDALATASELFGEGTLDAAAWGLGDYGVDPAAGASDDSDGTAATTASDGPSPAPPPALVRLLIDALASACAERRAEIALDPTALDQVLPPAPPPATCELFLTPTSKRSGWLLGLHAPAGASWGRFAGALGPALTDALAELTAAERAAHPDQRRLDVAYAPSPALADLCAHPPVRDGVLALSGWPALAGERGALTPSQLGLVAAPGVDPLALAARPAPGDERGEVVPSPLARVRSTTAPPGLYRLLAGFSLYRQHAPWALSLGALADLAYVPRISIDGFVVSPASWRIPANFDARAFRRWRAGGGDGLPRPPRLVQVGAEDQLLPVDLDRAQAWSDLAGQPRAWEIWPPLTKDARGASGTVDRDGRRVEAVVALVDVPDAGGAGHATEGRQAARQRAIALAGEVPPPRIAPAAPGWRTFALHGAEDRQEDVLLDAVVPAVRGALDAGEIDHWFFIRYAGERGHRPHLRVRAHAANRAHADRFAARLDQHLRAARESGAIALVESSGYHPELARFAGSAGTAAALHIFESDSDLACALIAGEGGGQQTDEALDRIDLLVAAFDGLAAGLGFALPERHRIARRRRDAESATLAALDAAEPRALDAEFRARARHLRAVLGAPTGGDPGDALARRIAAHRVHVGAAVAELPEATRARLAPPLLHLAAVRLAGTDRDVEARAYLFWERTLEGLMRHRAV